MRRRKSLTRKRHDARTGARHRESSVGRDEKVVLLARERDELLEQQTATSEVLKVISTSPGELEPVFQAMLANAVRICGATFGMLFRFEDAAWRAAAMFGVPPAFAEFWQRGPQRPGPRTALGRVAKTKQTVHIGDVTTEAAYIEREAIFIAAVNLGGFRTMLVVPMLKDNELIGAIAIYHTEVSPFTDKQVKLLTNFAAQAVIAIENARLLNELRHRTDDLSTSLEQQTATSEVLKVISGSQGDLNPVFDSILINATRICEASFANLVLVDGDELRVGATHNAPPAFAEALRLNTAVPRQTPVGQVIETENLVHIADVQVDEAYRNTRLAKQAGARTTLGVPMLKDNRPIGAILIYRQEVRPFTDKQIELVKNFASQAVIAIENARLLNELRSRTHELAASLDNLRTTQDRLVQTQKLASLGQLTAGIAHEIKNPLNFVNNFSGVSAELIDELQDALKGVPIDQKARAEINELTDTLRGNLDKVVQHGKRADTIVKNMLLHSREGSGEHRVVDINALVEDSLNLAYHGARAEKQGFNIALQRSFDPMAGEADIFPQEITRALLNFISNGFYAATKRRAEANGGCEPTLAASTKNLGDRVEITIRDNGAGIASDVKAKMFTPFFTTKPAGEGTGLGLSISHDIIVKQHAGTIEVHTQPGEFTEIRVTLPRAAALLPEQL